MLAKELVAASTEPLILSLLSAGENYGYALIQQVKRLSGEKIEWTFIAATWTGSELLPHTK